MSLLIREGNPSDFELKLCDKRKKDIDEPIYFNAGYFARLDNGETIPVGNLVINGSIITDAANQPTWLNTARHKLTTLVIHNNNTIEFVKVDDMMTVPAVKFAISGIPIIRNGYKVSLEEILSEGYFGNEMYDTWHGFLGIRQGKLVYVAMKCAFSQMYRAMAELGISDAIKLDGGGSFIDKYNDEENATSENRRINNIGILRLQETEQSKGSNEAMKILLIAGHGNGDCGACGCGYQEATLTREVVNLLKPQLDKYADVTIADTNKDWFEYLKTNSFNFKPYDYVLEIHFNACVNDTKGDGRTTGTEIYITTSEKGYSVEQNIVNGISNIGLKNRGVKRKNWSVISKVKKQGVSSALLEVCFIDDLDDMKLYQNKKSEIIRAITEGIVKGFNLKQKEIPEDSLTDACNLLASRGIINSPEYWAKGSDYSDENTVLLIKKFANYVKGVAG